MYNKFNNTIVANKVEDIPASELVEGVQIITFDSDKDYYSELPVDVTKTMIFSGRIFGRVLSFQGVINTPCYEWTELNGDVKILGTDYNQKKFGQLLVDFDNQLIEVLYDDNCRRPEIFHIDPEDEDENDKQMKMINMLYNNIFNIYDNNDLIYNQFINGTELTYHFLSIPFDKDNAIIFIYEHNLDITKKTWRVHAHTWIISRNYNAIELWDNMEDILARFSETNVGKHDSFIEFSNKEKFVAKYDMKNFLNANRDSVEDLAKIKEVFQYLRPNLHIEELFKPFYINEELKFKGYLSSYKEFRAGFYFNYDGTYINERKIKGLPNEEELSEEMRIAEAMFGFFEISKSGINPKDGLHYKNGLIAIANESQCIYRDADAMLIKFKSEYIPVPYIRIQQYWIRANEKIEKDKKLIQDMHDRKATMERLLKSK